MKLPLKVTIVYLLAILSVFLFVNLYGDKSVERAVTNRLKTEYSEQAALIAGEFGDRFYRSNASVQDVRNQLRLTDSVIDARIWIINRSGEILIDSRGIEPINIAIRAGYLLENSYNENVRIDGVFTEPMMLFGEPVIYDFVPRGYVFICIPMSRAKSDTVVYMNLINVGLLIISVVLLIAFAVIYMMAVYPTRRIRKAAMEYAKGNYEYPMSIVSHDEIRDLADTITYMVGEVRNVDDYQKKFIANISHDFRSPLTSIKGYAEAMKDGTIPYEFQGKYLDIILFEADRLTKLTSNLLDLNRIDSQGLMLDISSFDINQVIKNVAAAFEGICREKKIVIGLEFASFETYVDADMGRIQQVLYNLTDNAIKFSNSDSRVEIETEEKGSKVLVRVRDHGAGIPKDSIKKIWERFYKTDTSRGKDKKGTGLGLSIVKEVITAHDENISVISTEGVGTEFTFSLPLSEA